MEILSPYKEATEIITEAGGEPLRLCYQCGTCTGTCPWNMVKSFGVRRIIHQAQLGLTDFANEDMWTCVTCRACVERCPRGVGIIDVMRALRRAIVNLGIATVPDSLRLSVKNISAVGNPLGEVREKRAQWDDGKVKKYVPGASELLYFSCCIPAYDAKARRIAKATAAILDKLGAKYGVIGEGESCCGESVRKAGNEALFQSLAEGNIALFKENGVKQVVVSSPHCYEAFKKEYAELGGEFQVSHLTQYLAEQMGRGGLEFTREVKKRVIYHDPCYLGRHNGIYEEPRKVLGSIPGVEVLEFPESRESSMCCGGGGGRIWMETKRGERFSDIKVEQAVEAGAEVLAVACPYCFLNFEDSVLTMGKAEALVVRDVSELVAEAM